MSNEKNDHKNTKIKKSLAYSNTTNRNSLKV